MESVLVVGRVKPQRRRRADDLLDSALLDHLPRGLTRHSIYREGDTVALLFDGPNAEADFLRLLEDESHGLPELIACFENVPLLPRELRRVGQAA
jgi:hypothetical protein